MTRISTRPRLICLGAGALHHHHYVTLRKAGFHVIGVDRNPQAPAQISADEFCCIDPSNTEALTELARTRRADAILPLSEFGVVPAAIASVKAGLKQISCDSAQNATDKALMREFWARAGVDQPKFALVRSVTEAESTARRIGYPIVLKPRNLTAARGVRMVEIAGELATSFLETFSLSPDGVILEECIVGVETSVEGIIAGGKVTVLAYADKELRGHDKYRVTRSINYPGRFTDSQVAAIRRCAQDSVTALGLVNSPFHLEVFVVGERVVPIECAARGGGGHIFSVIVPQVSGIDFVSAAARLALGETLEIDEPRAPRGACYRFLFAPRGRFIGVDGIEGARSNPALSDLVITARPGQILEEPDSGIARPGFLVTVGRSRSEAYDAADRIEQNLTWRME